jgi:hypothetical protein
MVNNTQNYWLFWTLSIVRYSKNFENTTFRKADLFPSSGEGETPILLRNLERVNLCHSTTQVRFTTTLFYHNFIAYFLVISLQHSLVSAVLNLALVVQ